MKRGVNIEVLVAGLEKLRQLEASGERSAKELRQIQRAAKDVAAQIKVLTEETNRFNAALKRATGNKRANLGELTGSIRHGSPSSQIRNAFVQGQIRDFEATAQQMFARLNNRFAKGLRDFIKAAENSVILEMSKVRQRIRASDDLQTLRQRREAQAYRVVAAEFDLQGRSGEQKLRRAALETERNLLREIDREIERRVKAEKELEKLQNARLAIQRQIKQSHDEAYRALIRERDIQARINKMRLLEDPGFRLVDDSLARRRRIIGLERQVSQAGDPEIRALERQNEMRREQERIEKRLLRNQQELRAAREAGDLKERARLLIQRQQLRVDLQRQQTIDGRGPLLERELTRLGQIRQITARVLAEEKQRTAEIRARESISRQTEMNRLRSQDREHLRSINQLRESILFKDGGAFLFRVQAQLLGNYLLLNQLFNLFRFGRQFVIDLDRAFTQLQAITAATDTEMLALESSLIKVSERTKFTAVEVAEAATTMAQAGFSVKEIQDGIEAITLFATAVGEDLQKAVDLVTSTLNIFNLTASETPRIADVLTEAVNRSKLNIDKLSLGLQYAGQAAAQSGATFTELTAALGAFANAGVRRGSTLGTNLRQLLIELAAPSEKLERALRSVGLTLADVDVRANGLLGVFQNLREAGFGSAQAFEALEVRSAQALISISANLDVARDLEQAFLFTTAAEKAAETQTKSLSNTLDRFKSILGTFIAESMEPVKSSFRELVELVGQAVSSMREWGPIIPVIGTGLATAFGAALIARLGQLALHLTGIAAILPALAAAAAPITLSLTALSAVAAGGFVAYQHFSRQADELTSKTDQLQARINEARETAQTYENRINSLTEKIMLLADRSAHLTDNKEDLRTVVLELQREFTDWGLVIDGNVESLESLTEALMRLRSGQVQLQLHQLQEVRRGLQEQSATAIQELWQIPLTARGAGRFRGADPALDFAIDRAVSPFVTVGGHRVLFEGSSMSEIRENLTEVANALGGLENLRQRIRTGDPEVIARFAAQAGVPAGQLDTNKIISEAIDPLVEQLERLYSQLNRIAATRMELSAIDREIALQRFERDHGNLLLDTASNIRERLSLFNELSRGRLSPERRQMASSLLGGQNVGEFLTIDQRKSLIDTLGEQIERDYRMMVESLGELPGARSSESFVDLETAYQEFRKVRRTVTDAWDEANKELVEIQVKALEREIQAERKKFNDTTPVREIREALQRAEERYIAQRQRQFSVFYTDLLKRARDEGYSEDRINEEIEAFNAETLAGLELLRESAKRYFDTTIEVAEEIADASKVLRDELGNVKKRISQSLREIEFRFSANERLTGMMGRPEFQGRFSQVQIDAMNLAASQAQPQMWRQQRTVLDREIANLQTVQAGTGDALEREKAELERLKNIDRETLSQEQLRKLQEDIRETEREIWQLTKLQIDAEQEINNYKLQRLQVDQQIRDHETVSNMEDLSVSEAFERAAANYYESIRNLSKTNAHLSDSFRDVFSTAQDSFQGFVQGVTRGTASIKDAFRSMVISVVEALHEIATRQAAIQVFSMILGSINWGGVSSTPNLSAVNQRSGLVGGGVNMGGYIRAATGRAISTRDSVLALLRPGEYVLRNSAVEAIGRENLDMINAMGAASISRSAPVTPYSDGRGGEGNVVNVWIVAPDEKPQLGPNDVIHIINADIYRGGPTKKLIKSVQQGVV